MFPAQGGVAGRDIIKTKTNPQKTPEFWFKTNLAFLADQRCFGLKPRHRWFKTKELRRAVKRIIGTLPHYLSIMG